MSSRGDWRRNRIVRPLAAVTIVGLFAAGAGQLFFTSPSFCMVNTEIKSILGVGARVVAVAPTGQEAFAQRAIQAAISELARVDGLMKAHEKIDGVNLESADALHAYALDQAVKAMRQQGVPGGMIYLGRDCRAFGTLALKNTVETVPASSPAKGTQP
jgi:thiamine biosynthesis lipoprotein ApbE